MVKIILKEKADPGDSLYRMEFYCDAEGDVESLPTQTEGNSLESCATGSLAFILTPQSGKSKLRMLNSEGTWTEVGA